MLNSHLPPSIIPTIDPSAQEYVESLKSSALQSQGITSDITSPSSPGTDEEVPLVPGTLTLVPFDDGTVLKYLPRCEGSTQQVIVNSRGDQIAIARDESCAAMITDGVNVLFAALDEKQALENSVI